MANWNLLRTTPSLNRLKLTIIARHIHGYNLYETITFHQFPQKQLRHVEDQNQVWIVREYALSHGTVKAERDK